MSGCEALLPTDVRTPSAVKESDLTDDQAALLDACNATESDYSKFRLVEELPQEEDVRRFRLLAEVDLEQDGTRETVEVGARVLETRFDERPVEVYAHECVGTAFITEKPLE